MKKRLLFLLPAMAALLAGCDALNAFTSYLKPSKTVNLSFNEGQNLSKENKKGAIGDFSLVARSNSAPRRGFASEDRHNRLQVGPGVFLRRGIAEEKRRVVGRHDRNAVIVQPAATELHDALEVEQV